MHDPYSTFPADLAKNVEVESRSWWALLTFFSLCDSEPCTSSSLRDVHSIISFLECRTFLSLPNIDYCSHDHIQPSAFN